MIIRNNTQNNQNEINFVNLYKFYFWSQKLMLLGMVEHPIHNLQDLSTFLSHTDSLCRHLQEET